MAKSVLISGATGNIGYITACLVAKGDLFGKDIPINLKLLGKHSSLQRLIGMQMELQDSSLPCLERIEVFTDLSDAFKDVDICIMVCSTEQKFSNNPRVDLLAENAKIIQEQAKALDEHAKVDVKVLVVSNPVNTNCLVAINSVTKLKPENFTALTLLDVNRAKYFLADHISCATKDIQNLIAWGNHGRTIYPDLTLCTVKNKPILDTLSTDEWLKKSFVQCVQGRGEDILRRQQKGSSLSVALAIIDHLHKWIYGTKANEVTSMGVLSDGSYGISKGIVFSLPVTCENGGYHIVKGLPINAEGIKHLQLTMKDLNTEKELAQKFLGLDSWNI